MRSLLRVLWPDDMRLCWMHTMGFTQFALLSAATIYLLLAEASDLVAEGTVFFVVDASLRVVGGLLFSVTALLPYIVASMGCGRVGHTTWFLGLTIGVFVVHLSLSMDAIFFASDSTAPLGLLFMPLYLAAPALVLWGCLHVADKWL